MERINGLLLLGVLVLNLADMWLTNAVLSRGGAEVNPAMRWLMHRLGVLPAMLIAKIAGAAVPLWYGYTVAGNTWLFCALVIGLAGFYGWVVYHNWRQLRRIS